MEKSSPQDCKVEYLSASLLAINNFYLLDHLVAVAGTLFKQELALPVLHNLRSFCLV